mgnify:CR=1 FL=1|tara:strand:- start:45 stop:500 length:456 start_codon:yes stop_codon:yes gene_type:complete
MGNKEKKLKIGIWNLVAIIYSPIIFFSLLIILPKVKWEYVLESQESKLTRHLNESKEFGYPGIPYISNTGTSRYIYVSKNDIAYGECGWNFYCLPEELNNKKGTHYLPINPPIKRIRNNVVKLDNIYFCNSLDVNGSGKCTSNGWKYGSER